MSKNHAAELRKTRSTYNRDNRFNPIPILTAELNTSYVGRGDARLASERSVQWKRRRAVHGR